MTPTSQIGLYFGAVGCLLIGLWMFWYARNTGMSVSAGIWGICCGIVGLACQQLPEFWYKTVLQTVWVMGVPITSLLFTRNWRNAVRSGSFRKLEARKRAPTKASTLAKR